MLIRRFFAFVISAFLIFFPAYSYAASAAGWGATNADATINGATATIKAFKQGAAGAAQAVINHKPSAAAVGKGLMRAGGGLALALAATQLVDGALDWVLDPSNNTLRYKHPADAPLPVNGYWGNMWGQQFATHTLAMQSNCDEHNSGAVVGAFYDGIGYQHGCEGILGNDGVYAGSVAVGSYAVTITLDPQAPAITPPHPERSIPVMTTVANKVLANAAAGHKDSQDFVKAVAVGQANAGELDKALNAASVPATSTPTADAPTYVDPTLPTTQNPDVPAEPVDPVDPAAPFDPSSIIAAINSLKAMLAGILSSMTGFFDWVKAPVPPEEEKKPVPFGTTESVGLDSVDRFEERIDFSGQCPVNDFSFTMMGVTYAKPIPYYHFCGFLEQIAPWLLAMCYLGTAYFVVENI